jgi:hypothetical protein
MVAFAVGGTPEEWLVLGLQIVGFGPNRQNRCQETTLERFLAHFGSDEQL